MDVSGREFGKHFCKVWVLVKPGHISVTAEPLVGQNHEGGNWIFGLEGGVHCVAQEFKHYSIIMWGMEKLV